PDRTVPGWRGHAPSAPRPRRTVSPTSRATTHAAHGPPPSGVTGMVRFLRVFPRGRWLAAACATTLTVSAAASPLFSADLRLDYKPAAYAIKGVTVVTGKGEPIAPGTVVVRDGVIEAVGPADKVEIPYDAETIDGKGLHVYPGFLDLFSTVGQ